MNEQNRYTFLKSRSGEDVPAFILPNGETQPLHSMIDPKKEAVRLISSSSIADNDFVIFLGLGGGFAPLAALEQTDSMVVVIDFNKDDIKELLNGKDYSALVNNNRFTLLVDLSPEELKTFIIENFNPALSGGIKTIPLRTRTEKDAEKFENAAQIIKSAIEIISGDYSVQAHFGIRWFSNIIRNIMHADNRNDFFYTELKKRQIEKSAVVAAGPSLDQQLASLKKFKSQGGFVISSDTALGALLHNGIEADIVVSIDCQHISYYHFAGLNARHIPLVLDIASPPLLCGLTSKPVFFLSGHPLALYLNSSWKRFPMLDTSGGNVTYACLSLAESLNIPRITLFGSDFSYVKSRTYARGTYIYPYFHNRQNRLSPLEAQMSRFLYRSPFLPSEQKKDYYETSSLKFYREKLEEKVSCMRSAVTCEPGSGARINLSNFPQGEREERKEGEEEGKDNKTLSGKEFLINYRDDILALPEAGERENYLSKLKIKEKRVFITLLPFIAGIKKRKPELKLKELITEAKRLSAKKIDSVLKQSLH